MTLVVGALHDGTPWPLVGLMAAAVTVALANGLYVWRRRSR
jgi:uncharacterized iron-regulated membrane protein